MNLVSHTLFALVPYTLQVSGVTLQKIQTNFQPTVGYEGQPATFARLADEQLIRWMTLDQIALHPRDYPGIDEDITQEEFECRQKILDSLSYSEEQKQYTTALPWRGLDRPSTNEDAAYALQSKTWDRLLRQDPEFLKHYIKTFKDGYEWGYFVKVPKEDLAKKDGGVLFKS